MVYSIERSFTVFKAQTYNLGKICPIKKKEEVSKITALFTDANFIYSRN